MPNVTYLKDDAAVAIRAAEVPNADFDTGLNAGGSCAPAIGINAAGGAVAGTPEQFTLLDQAEAARTPQDSQTIGGSVIPVRIATPTATGDGDVVDVGAAHLVTLSAGWVAV